MESLNACHACGSRVSTRAKWCSESCRQWANRNPGQARDRTCAECGDPLPRLARRYCSLVCSGRARGIPYRDQVPHDCQHCGVTFTTHRPNVRYCSDQCQRNAAHKRHRERHPQVWTDARRDAYHRRRARKQAAATGRPVRMAEIRQRDADTCGLCGDPVGNERWPHPLSPSLDHVVPLSRGGAHDPDNVQLAHLSCNVRKGGGGPETCTAVDRWGGSLEQSTSLGVH